MGQTICLGVRATVLSPPFHSFQDRHIFLSQGNVSASFVSLPGHGTCKNPFGTECGVLPKGICHIWKGIFSLFKGKLMEVFFEHYLLQSEKALLIVKLSSMEEFW